MEEKISRFEEKLQDMERQFDLLNVEIEEWRAKYAHLEVEKERLFQEVEKELSLPAEKEKSLAKEVESQKRENEELKKYLRKLEKEHFQSHKAHVKDFTELSRKQQKRRIDTLTARAQKAL
ncbi:uncharacterized protein [Montipora capricornis]|uniref:uncharacterized protein n=1 Tax=Montipora capricornis TaxID=246305 RepID=UPI0035F1F4C3